MEGSSPALNKPRHSPCSILLQAPGVEAVSLQPGFTRVGISLNGRCGHISVTWKEKVGQGGRKAGRARAVPASTAGARVTLVYALARPGVGGRWPDTARGPGWGPIKQIADTGSRTSASALPGSALPTGRAQSLCSAPCLAHCPVPERTTLRLMSHAPRGIAILLGTPSPL